MLAVSSDILNVIYMIVITFHVGVQLSNDVWVELEGRRGTNGYKVLSLQQ
jgi:hypothetical protein